jgi:hypothetical protein
MPLFNSVTVWKYDSDYLSILSSAIDVINASDSISFLFHDVPLSIKSKRIILSLLISKLVLRRKFQNKILI